MVTRLAGCLRATLRCQSTPLPLSAANPGCMRATSKAPWAVRPRCQNEDPPRPPIEVGTYVRTYPSRASSPLPPPIPPKRERRDHRGSRRPGIDPQPRRARSPPTATSTLAPEGPAKSTQHLPKQGSGAASTTHGPQCLHEAMYPELIFRHVQPVFLDLLATKCEHVLWPKWDGYQEFLVLWSLPFHLFDLWSLNPDVRARTRGRYLENRLGCTLDTDVAPSSQNSRGDSETSLYTLFLRCGR